MGLVLLIAGALFVVLVVPIPNPWGHERPERVDQSSVPAILGGTPQPQPTSTSWLQGQWHTASGQDRLSVQSDGTAVLESSGNTINLKFNYVSLGKFDGVITKGVNWTAFTPGAHMLLTVNTDAYHYQTLELTSQLADPLTLYRAS